MQVGDTRGRIGEEDTICKENAYSWIHYAVSESLLIALSERLLMVFSSLDVLERMPLISLALSV